MRRFLNNIGEYLRKYYQKQLENEYGISTKNINLRKRNNNKEQPIAPWKEHIWNDRTIMHRFLIINPWWYPLEKSELIESNHVKKSKTHSYNSPSFRMMEF